MDSISPDTDYQARLVPPYQKLVRRQNTAPPPPTTQTFADYQKALSRLAVGAPLQARRAVNALQQVAGRPTLLLPVRTSHEAPIHFMARQRMSALKDLVKLGETGDRIGAIATKMFQESHFVKDVVRHAVRTAQEKNDFVKLTFHSEKLFVSPQGKVYLATGEVHSGSYKDTYKALLIGHPSAEKVADNALPKFRAISLPKNREATEQETDEIRNEMFVHQALKTWRREVKKQGGADPFPDIGIGRTFANSKTRNESLVTPYFEGGNLADFLVSEAPKLGTESKHGLALQILASAGQLHKYGVVHRDLKPDNIMIQKQILNQGAKKQVFYSIKIVDFGKASLIDETHRYLPDKLPLKYFPANPTYDEMFSPTIDTYSLGVVLYQLYGGLHMKNTPLFHSVRQNLEGRFLMNETWGTPTEIPREIKALILDMTQADATRRPATEQCINYLLGLPSTSPSPRSRRH